MTGSNLLLWSLQIAVLILVAALSVRILRLRAPAARLLYWQFVLLACLILPLVQPWKHEVADGIVAVSSVAVVRPVTTAAHRTIPVREIFLWLLAAGIVGKAGWLAAGFWRLRQYRHVSRPIGSRDGASLMVCDGIASPVTFGVFRPVVLLPPQFPDLDSPTQEAILCHELLHVRRRDWVFTVAEELVRTVFWFHPAIWWALGEIGLAREQEVDRQVVEQTRSRDQYVDALLAIAGARPQLDLAPAPLFLRKRHLKQRVVSILKEVSMSKTRLLSSLAGALTALVAAGWLITTTFPLAAAPEVVVDAAGVSVDLGGASLMHRSGVAYPDEARKRGVQGLVVVQVKIDNGGNVADAQVLSGPDDLRKPVLSSVLNWHFTKDLAGSLRQVSVQFEAGLTTLAAAPPPPPPPPPPPAPAGRGGKAAAALEPRTLRSITVAGLSDQARAELLAALPHHEGETLGPQEIGELAKAVKAYDSHLAAMISPAPEGWAITIRPVDTSAPPVSQTPFGDVPSRIRVGGNVASTKLVSKATPAYPALAKQSRVQGVVSLDAIIAKDGTVANLTVISGHPLLVPAAVDAVRQWVYQPTLLNGNPVEVETQIDVNFTLSE
jgi:protein TonB